MSCKAKRKLQCPQISYALERVCLRDILKYSLQESRCIVLILFPSPGSFHPDDFIIQLDREDNDVIYEKEERGR